MERCGDSDACVGERSQPDSTARAGGSGGDAASAGQPTRTARRAPADDATSAEGAARAARRAAADAEFVKAQSVTPSADAAGGAAQGAVNLTEAVGANSTAQAVAPSGDSGGESDDSADYADHTDNPRIVHQPGRRLIPAMVTSLHGFCMNVEIGGDVEYPAEWLDGAYFRSGDDLGDHHRAFRLMRAWRRLSSGCHAGDMCLMEFGCISDLLCTSCSRTVSRGGAPQAWLARARRSAETPWLKRAQSAARSSCRGLHAAAGGQ